jgi:hypothetical protein
MVMNAAERRQEVRDASAAVARGKANTRQKKLHDSKIKSEAKNNKKRRDSLAAIAEGRLRVNNTVKTFLRNVQLTLLD